MPLPTSQKLKLHHLHNEYHLKVIFACIILFVFTVNFRYHQFKGAWQANKAPGEKSHKNLRWNVRVRIIIIYFGFHLQSWKQGLHCCAVCSSHQSLCKQFWVHFFQLILSFQRNKVLSAIFMIIRKSHQI